MSTKNSEDESAGFTAEERAAMKERAAELKRQQNKADGEADLQAKIAGLPGPDQSMAQKLDAIVKRVAPDLEPRTYYGMPAYAKDGKVLVFFQPASKFGARYATLGFNDGATLDDGTMWPTSWEMTKRRASGCLTSPPISKRSL